MAIGLIAFITGIESGYIGYRTGFDEGMTKGYVEGVSWSTKYIKDKFPDINNSTLSSAVKDNISYCAMNYESWIERGGICHSNPAERMLID
jgi:hypothetical protein